MDSRPAALLVDDDPGVAESVRLALTDRAVQIDVAVDAVAAVKLLEANHYCGIVVDLPSSPAVLRHMTDRSISVPVVVTANELPTNVVHSDVKLLLSRPVETSLLASTILGLCGIES